VPQLTAFAFFWRAAIKLIAVNAASAAFQVAWSSFLIDAH
jgi:hypothetical protein